MSADKFSNLNYIMSHYPTNTITDITKLTCPKVLTFKVNGVYCATSIKLLLLTIGRERSVSDVKVRTFVYKCEYLSFFATLSNLIVVKQRKYFCRRMRELGALLPNKPSNISYNLFIFFVIC